MQSSKEQQGEIRKPSSAQLNQTGNLNLNTANNSSTLKGKLQLLEEQKAKEKRKDTLN